MPLQWLKITCISRVPIISSDQIFTFDNTLFPDGVCSSCAIMRASLVGREKLSPDNHEDTILFGFLFAFCITITDSCLSDPCVHTMSPPISEFSRSYATCELRAGGDDKWLRGESVLDYGIRFIIVTVDPYLPWGQDTWYQGKHGLSLSP